MKELESFLRLQSSEITKKDYRISIEQFFNYANINKLEDLLKLDIDKYVDYRDYLLEERQNSQNTVNTRFRAISSFLTYLREERNIDTPNYACSVAKRLKPQPKKGTSLNSMEAIKLLNVCKNPREYAIIMLLLNNGLRISELINLEYEDYDYQAKTISIIRKGGLKKTIPISEQVNRAILDYLKYRKNTSCTKLFVSNGGGIMSAYSINRTIKKLTQKAKIETNISAHSLRRTLATDLHRSGYDIKEIKDVLGHKSINTTAIYIKDEEENVKRVVKEHGFLPTGGIYVK